MRSRMRIGAGALRVSTGSSGTDREPLSRGKVEAHRLLPRTTNDSLHHDIPSLAHGARWRTRHRSRSRRPRTHWRTDRRDAARCRALRDSRPHRREDAMIPFVRASKAAAARPRSGLASTRPAGTETLRLSVVIPTYRRPDLLCRCLEAVFAQTLDRSVRGHRRRRRPQRRHAGDRRCVPGPPRAGRALGAAAPRPRSGGRAQCRLARRLCARSSRSPTTTRCPRPTGSSAANARWRRAWSRCAGRVAVPRLRHRPAVPTSTGRPTTS